MIMIEAVKDWIEVRLPNYRFAFNQWVEIVGIANQKYAVIQQAGGSPTAVDVRRGRFRVVLMGRRGERGDSKEIMQDADSLIQSSLANTGDPCGAASIRVMGEYTGAAFTTEDRAWVQLDFEVIF